MERSQSAPKGHSGASLRPPRPHPPSKVRMELPHGGVRMEPPPLRGPRTTPTGPSGVPRPAAGVPHRGADACPACTHSFWLSPAWLLGWKSLTMMPSCRMFSTNFSRCSSRWSNFSAMAGTARPSVCSSQRLELGPVLCFRLPDARFRFLEEGGISSGAGSSAGGGAGLESLAGKLLGNILPGGQGGGA